MVRQRGWSVAAADHVPDRISIYFRSRLKTSMQRLSIDLFLSCGLSKKTDFSSMSSHPAYVSSPMCAVMVDMFSQFHRCHPCTHVAVWRDSSCGQRATSSSWLVANPFSNLPLYCKHVVLMRRTMIYSAFSCG